jgi:7-cyano-7-deazaguanine synthase
MSLKTEGALVLFSGGQDSATCLAWALTHYEHVETIGFDYGQRHRIELDCRVQLLAGVRNAFPQWARRLHDDHLVRMPFINEISETALTRDVAIEMGTQGLPNTFVPGRNGFFLYAAAAVAYRRGLTTLVGGMCETDYSGYPDCRDTTIKAIQVALQLSMDRGVVVETPLMRLDKADTWALARELGGNTLVQLIIDESHTCYLGERGQKFAWGRGCGKCPACTLRLQGYDRYSKRETATA